LDIDNRNRVKLSIKEITEEEKAAFEAAEADVAS
jgi:polyribonucleotide nucleotidyltransferase